jgi:hypothetical protein
MSARLLAAAVSAGALVIGIALIPVDAPARMGTFAGRAAPAAFTGARPLMARPGPAAPGGIRAPTVAHRETGMRRFGHHGVPSRNLFGPGFGWPIVTWDEPGYSTYYAPSNYQMLHDLPPEEALPPYPPYPPPYPVQPPVVTERVIPIVISRPSCGTEKQTVAWRDGSERTITIVRC